MWNHGVATCCTEAAWSKAHRLASTRIYSSHAAALRSAELSEAHRLQQVAIQQLYAELFMYSACLSKRSVSQCKSA